MNTPHSTGESTYSTFFLVCQLSEKMSVVSYCEMLKEQSLFRMRTKNKLQEWQMGEILHF